MTVQLGQKGRKGLMAIAVLALFMLNLNGALAAGGGSGVTATAMSEASPSGLLGDLDGDCDVDIEDIMMVTSRWHTSCDNPDPDSNPDTPSYDALYDINDDCVIDIVDIMLVAVQWGDTCPWVGGCVWYDDDGDGVRDEIEVGLAGVSVDLYRDSDGDGVLGPDDTYLDTQTTAEDGGYWFCVSAGDYIVQVPETVTLGLADYALTTGNPLSVHLGEGETYSGADFGYEALASPA